MRLGPGIALLLCAAGHAAEPAASPASVSATPAATTAPRPAKAPVPVPARPESRKPLDLRVGDVREYMRLEELNALVGAPDPDKNTIVVQGTRLLPVEKIEDVPGGLASLWYAAKHPTQAWRIFAPVVNAPALEKPSPVPPPVFRWGP